MEQQTEEQAFRQLFRSSVFLSPELFPEKSLQIIRIKPEAVAQKPGQLQFNGSKEGVGEINQAKAPIRTDEDVVRVQITVNINCRFRASFIQIRPSFLTEFFRERISMFQERPDDAMRVYLLGFARSTILRRLCPIRRRSAPDMCAEHAASDSPSTYSISR